MIRRATEKDIPEINNLLRQVLKIHADIRPDIFKADTKKYTDEELKAIILDDTKPILVSTDESDRAVGYAFLVIEEIHDSNILCDEKSIYIDDLCVDEKYRGKHIAKELYEYIQGYAKNIGCNTITLNVWEGNEDAYAFYRAMGLQPRKHVMEVRLY